MQCMCNVLFKNWVLHVSDSVSVSVHVNMFESEPVCNSESPPQNVYNYVGRKRKNMTT